jgi:hypothetical protein
VLIVIIAIAWVAVALVFGCLIGRGVRIADRRTPSQPGEQVRDS